MHTKPANRGGLMPASVYKATRRRARNVTLALAAMVAGVGVGSYWYGTTTQNSQPVSSAALLPVSHVVTIMEENHNITQITSSSMPYLVGLGNKYGKATNVSAITHPSLPNYFAFTSGSTQGKTSDCGSSTSGCTTGADNIYHQGSWKQWSESMPFACDHSNSGSYVVHHAIPPFYTDLNSACVANDVPFSKSNVPAISAKYTFLTPNNLDNAHSASLGAADNWLKTVMPKLLAQSNFTNGSTLIEVTFDEGSSGNNKVYVAFLNPRLAGKVVTTTGTHYSMLRLNEELLGYPLLAKAATAPDLRPSLGL